MIVTAHCSLPSDSHSSTWDAGDREAHAAVDAICAQLMTSHSRVTLHSAWESASHVKRDKIRLIYGSAVRIAILKQDPTPRLLWFQILSK